MREGNESLGEGRKQQKERGEEGRRKDGSTKFGEGREGGGEI